MKIKTKLSRPLLNGVKMKYSTTENADARFKI